MKTKLQKKHIKVIRAFTDLILLEGETLDNLIDQISSSPEAYNNSVERSTQQIRIERLRELRTMMERMYGPSRP